MMFRFLIGLTCIIGWALSVDHNLDVLITGVVLMMWEETRAIIDNQAKITENQRRILIKIKGE